MMRQNRPWSRAGWPGPAVVAVLLLVGLAGSENLASELTPGASSTAPRDEPGLRGKATYELGKRLFFEETFEGNGRTCAMCHDPHDGFTITPARVRAIFRQDRTHPLFQPRDSDGGDGQRFSILGANAVFSVEIELHDRVWPENEPSRRILTVRRGVPSIVNVRHTPPYQLDGRAKTLEDQAEDMILNFFAPGREPKSKELRALTIFLDQVLSPARLLAFVPGDITPVAPEFSLPVPGEAARRGKQVFETHCARCHAGELLHRPAGEGEPIFHSVMVSERNTPGLPLQRLVFADSDGATTVVQTPDPGRAAVTGRLEDLNTFEVPALRGLAHTAPYFHDNSAASLSEVIEHYNTSLGFGIAPGAFEDLLAYLESL